MMAKRGVEVEGVYFHSPPYTSEWAKEKVIDLAKRIADFTGEFRLYVVPFTELQLYLLDNTAHDRLTIHLKRAMMRAAEMIAHKDDALALVTGESVGQVASQTMQGICLYCALWQGWIRRKSLNVRKKSVHLKFPFARMRTAVLFLWQSIL